MMDDLDINDDIQIGNGIQNSFFPTADKSINNISAISSNKNNSTKIGDTSKELLRP